MLGLDQFSTFAEGLDHPEGVAWGPDGRIYAGGEAGQIYAVGLDGAVEQVASTGGFILGLALDSSGVVYACDTVRHEVVRVYPDGRCETHTAGTNDRPLQLPNWPVFDGDGVLYVTDSGSWHGNDGAVFRVDPRGDTTVWTTEPRQFPNGCALDITGDALYVAESTLPGVSRIPIRSDGSAGEREPFVLLPGTVPDGLAFDVDGNLYVACYRPDRIYRVDRDGRAEVLADDPEGTQLSAPTNVVFAGRGLDHLVIASIGRWHLTIADVGAIGAPLHYPTVPSWSG